LFNAALRHPQPLNTVAIVDVTGPTNGPADLPGLKSP